jgi:hypothetical protein
MFRTSHASCVNNRNITGTVRQHAEVPHYVPPFYCHFLQVKRVTSAFCYQVPLVFVPQLDSETWLHTNETITKYSFMHRIQNFTFPDRKREESKQGPQETMHNISLRRAAHSTRAITTEDVCYQVSIYDSTIWCARHLISPACLHIYYACCLHTSLHCSLWKVNFNGHCQQASRMRMIDDTDTHAHSCCGYAVPATTWHTQ